MPKAAKGRTSPTERHNPLSERSVNRPASKKAESQPKTQGPAEKTAESAPAATRKVPTNTIVSEASSAYQTLPGPQSNYLVQVSIDDTQDPAVTRTLSIPGRMTFYNVHQILQIAFGWAGCRSHSFYVHLSDATGMTLNGVPMGSLKLSIGSGDTVDILSDDDNDIKYVDEKNITLAEVYDNPEYKGKAVIQYEYEHRDSWAHNFSLIGRTVPDWSAQMHAPSALQVLCVGGEGHPVAENCDGTDGWRDLKHCFKRGKRGDPEDRREWYKDCCLNGQDETFNPYHWDIVDVNQRLGAVFAPEGLKSRYSLPAGLRTADPGSIDSSMLYQIFERQDDRKLPGRRWVVVHA